MVGCGLVMTGFYRIGLDSGKSGVETREKEGGNWEETYRRQPFVWTVGRRLLPLADHHGAYMRSSIPPQAGQREGVDVFHSPGGTWHFSPQSRQTAVMPAK